MATDTHGLEALQSLSSNPPAAPVEPKHDAFGRAYATGKRKNAVARVWLKPGKGSITITGRKLDQKTYFWHTGYPGGIKERTAGKILGGRFPERVLEKAVERMLPKESPLARKQLTHLRIYNAPEHPHAAQNPETIAFADLNAKNVRSA
jgi:hypothetical protein